MSRPGPSTPKQGQEIMEIFRELHQRGRTIVLITHDRSVAEQADQVITLVDGEVQSDEQRRSSAMTAEQQRRRQPLALPVAGSDSSLGSDGVADAGTWLADGGRMGVRDLARTALREGCWRINCAVC